MNKIKKVFLALAFHLNPSKIMRDIQKKLTIGKYQKAGFLIIEPNYLIKPIFEENDVAIDVGCGFEVELASFLIDHYHMRCFCVDPTKKHEPLIQKKVDHYQGQLTYFQNALCSENCTLTFNETIDNESGSLLSDHVNILHDRINQYSVQGIDLKTLIGKTGTNEIAFLKIDIEGAEYALFENIDEETLIKCHQIFIEFHHVSVKRFKKRDTFRIVKKIKTLGFEGHTLDGLNYLFLRK